MGVSKSQAALIWTPDSRAPIVWTPAKRITIYSEKLLTNSAHRAGHLDELPVILLGVSRPGRVEYRDPQATHGGCSGLGAVLRCSLVFFEAFLEGIVDRDRLTCSGPFERSSESSG